MAKAARGSWYRAGDSYWLCDCKTSIMLGKTIPRASMISLSPLLSIVSYLCPQRACSFHGNYLFSMIIQWICKDDFIQSHSCLTDSLKFYLLGFTESRFTPHGLPMWFSRAPTFFAFWQYGFRGWFNGVEPVCYYLYTGTWMLIPGVSAFLSLPHEMHTALIEWMLANMTVTLEYRRIRPGFRSSWFCS